MLEAWLWLSALATAGGWLLSSIHQLNFAGYFAFFFVAGLLLWFFRHQLFCASPPSWHPQFSSWHRRFRRPWPLCFAILALLILIGGLLYPPTNHTGLSYRLPRVLHWLAEQRWHWIHTPNYRMNNRACGIEWLTVPLVVFTRSDRLLFLLNYVPFLLLPGLIFSVWKRLGVRPRVAWHWMWIVPTGYVFLLQAGSIGNDAFPALYALAAVDFALRALRPELGPAKTSKAATQPGIGAVSNLAYSVLAAALLTGAKASNLPLLLPWVAALSIFFFRRGASNEVNSINSFNIINLITSSTRGTAMMLRSHPFSSTATIILAVLVSFLPTAWLNIQH